MLHLFFGGHFIFWQPFCFMEPIIFGKKMWSAIMNYHAKSGAPNMKINWVMLNLVLGDHFVFWWPFCFLEKKIAEGHRELTWKIWSF